MTRPLRVACVADSDAWGGAEVYLATLLRRAGALGWAPHLVCAEPVAGRFAARLPDVPTAVVPLSRHADDAPALRAALAAARPDVVLVNLVDPASNAAALAAALALAPTAATLHLDGDTREGAGRAALAGLYRRLAAVLSPSARGAAQARADLGVPADRVHVVWNGVDLPPVPAGPAGSAVPRVGALGRLTAQKGFDVLIEAVRLLAGRAVPVEVVVGGEGRDGDRLRAAAAGLPVRFPGFVEDTRAFLRGLDVFCLSSRREAMPLVLLEAMSEGLPCVATDVGDVVPAVADAALVVPAGDAVALAGALEEVLRAPGRRAELGRRARARAAEELDADLMAARTAAVLSAAAARR